MRDHIAIVECDPASPPARAMGAALWDEIQHRYGFTAADPYDPTAFAGPLGGFWVATDRGSPVGSVAMTPVGAGVAELDLMYVAPSHRGTGLAQALLAALEAHAWSGGIRVVRLRAGEPQSEALAFYAAAGLTPIPPFGKWVQDETARCFEKLLDSAPT